MRPEPLAGPGFAQCEDRTDTLQSSPTEAYARSKAIIDQRLGREIRNGFMGCP